jgi:hypothetical protein
MSNPNFFSDPGYTTIVLTSTLDDDVNTIQTSILINNASNFPTKGQVLIDSEIILYNSKNGNNLENCYRSNPEVHSIGSIITLLGRYSDAPIQHQQINSGWYKERGNSNKTLRIGDSNLMMPGTIRFNESNTIFQGFNGNEWVDFNATQGPTGDPGLNASQLFNFINLPVIQDSPRGEVFQSSGTTNVFLRSIQGSIVDINAGLTALSLTVENETNYVKLTPQPRPYVWDFTLNNNLSYLRSLVTDTKFKAYGTVGKWIVKNGSQIKAGMAVRLTVDVTLTKMVIEPYTYSNVNNFFNLPTNQTGLGFLGIALENKTGDSYGQSCEVCTEGITTAIIGDNSNPPSNGIQSKSEISPGLYAFINYNGSIFSPNNLTSVISILPIAGYWVDKISLSYYTSGNVVNNNLGLFYVKGGINI